MADLIKLIRERAARGEISHLSITNPTGREWQASYAPSHAHGVSRAAHADPIEALVAALSAPPKSRTKAKTEKPNAKEPDPVDDLDFDSPDDMDFG